MYVFYDLETTDTDPDFGQILQIGVVVTDDNLNIVQTHSLRARRQPWVVPSPEALLITGIAPAQLENTDEASLFEAMRAFEKILRDAGQPVIRAGYNNIRFDEPGVASASHQNLLPAMAQGACIDTIKLVQACFIHKPGFLRLDEKTSKGHAKMTLGAVARQNGVELSEDDAHEAVGDVRATIGVTKLIRDGAPEIWDQMLALATPRGVQDFIGRNDIFCMSDIFYAKPRSRILTSAGSDIGFDLSADPAAYMDKTAEEIAFAMTQKNNPFVPLEKDKFPILMPESLTPANLYPAKIDRATLEARAALIKNSPAFREKIAQAAALNRNSATPPDIERQGNEPVSADVAPLLDAWKKEFQDGGWPERAALIQDFPVRFAEALQTTPALNRFVQFARRVVFDNAPEQMTQADRDRYKAAIYTRIMDKDPPEGMMTIPGARMEIELLRKELYEGTSKVLTPETEYKLNELAAYYDALEAKYAPPAPNPMAGPSPTP